MGLRRSTVHSAGAIRGGVWYPGDATVNPGTSALALAKRASDLGATVREGVRVDRISVASRRVQRVQTAEGFIECVVVVAAGLWSPQVLQAVDVPLALHAAEHVWMMTSALDQPAWDL